MVPWFPLLGLTPSGFSHISSTLIYTSELILCSTIYLDYDWPRTEFGVIIGYLRLPPLQDKDWSTLLTTPRVPDSR